MVLKIADGSMRAADVAIAGMLAQMAEHLNLDRDMLNKFSVEEMYNSTNTKVGVCQYANIMPIQN